MQHHRVSHPGRTLGRGRVASLGLALLAALALAPSAAVAQGAPATYPDPLLSLPDAESTGFSQWVISASLRVPTAALQAVLDAQAGGPGFVALGSAVPGQSSVSVSATFEQIRMLASGELSGPNSIFSVTTAVFNATLPGFEVVILRQWNSNSAFSNALFGTDATTQAELEWEIEQEEGEQVLKAKVKGSDGFKASLKSLIVQGLGARGRNDPVGVRIRILSDGPGGLHPTFRQAQQFDAIPVAAGMVSGFKAGDILSLPGGDLPITALVPGSVLRGFADRIDVD